MKLGRKIRALDQILQKDRHKVKVFGLIEKIQSNPDNYTEETEDELMDNLMEKIFKDLHVKVGIRDIEEAVRVGFWERELPRAVKVSLATANLKETLLHENNEIDLKGFDIVDDRPYGVTVEIDKPEDCTLDIKNISEAVFVTNVTNEVGAILTDPTTETTELYILPTGTLKSNPTDLLNVFRNAKS